MNGPPRLWSTEEGWNDPNLWRFPNYCEQSDQGGKVPTAQGGGYVCCHRRGIVFSKIDLWHAYLQMELDDGARELCTINTHKGLYQYNRLPFGVSSAPAIWQRAMEQVLQGVQCLLDDIIVAGATKD